PSLVPPPAVAQGGLFGDTTRQADAPEVLHRTVVRQRQVGVNQAVLDSAMRPGADQSGPGATLTLNLFTAAAPLFPEVSVTATRDRVERTSSGQGAIWSGRVPGDRFSQVTLVAENGVLVGDVRAHGH